jgi:hypothetical protein
MYGRFATCGRFATYGRFANRPYHRVPGESAVI